MLLVLYKNVCRIKLCKRFYSIKEGFRILGIETSCDETSAAVLNNAGQILSESHFSQNRFHLESGGIVPNVAMMFHRHYIKKIVDDAILQSKTDFKDLAGIAVTVKPGLLMCLTEGVNYAKSLCSQYQVPLIPIHHMKAHTLIGRMFYNVEFPFMTFLISGKHCILALVNSPEEFLILGESNILPPGLLLDKICQLIQIKNLKEFRGMSGGAAVEAAAKKGNPMAFELLKTFKKPSCCTNLVGVGRNARNVYKQLQEQNTGEGNVISTVYDLCASLQFNMIRLLCRSLETAFRYIADKNLLSDNKCLILSGGCASNEAIRTCVQHVCNVYQYKMVVPPSKYCTDNGLMVAWNGLEILRKGLPVVHPKDLDSVIPITSSPVGEDISKDVEANFPDGKKFIKSEEFLKCLGVYENSNQEHVKL